jgi:hypothetical protein
MNNPAPDGTFHPPFFDPLAGVNHAIEALTMNSMVDGGLRL